MRKFGLELEVNKSVDREHITDVIRYASPKKVLTVDGWAQTNHNDYWHVKRDASCGWEIASFIGSSMEELEHIAFIADRLRQQGAEVDENCGFHIHADVSDFTPAQAGVVVARWVKIESFLLQLVPEHRRDNVYCVPLFPRIHRKVKKNKYTPLAFWNVIKPKNLYPHDNNHKKTTLNTVNYAAKLHYAGKKNIPSYGNRPTMEFRLPEGTLQPEAIINWTLFFTNFIDYAKMGMLPLNLEPVETLKKFFLFSGLSNKQLKKNKDLLDVNLWFLKRFGRYGLASTQYKIHKLMF